MREAGENKVASGPSRRQLLGALGAVTVPLAGCPLQGGSDTSTPTDTSDATPMPNAVEPLTEGFSDRVNGILDEMSVREQAGQTAFHAARDAPPSAITSTIQSTGVGGGVLGDGKWQLPAGPYNLAVGDQQATVDVTETITLE